MELGSGSEDQRTVTTTARKAVAKLGFTIIAGLLSRVPSLIPKKKKKVSSGCRGSHGGSGGGAI